MHYRLPETLEGDIVRFASLANDYKQKQIAAVQFKAFRVPMGIYEQRQDEVYMSRVRTTGGVITPKQFSELIEIAKRHHSELLHITTRQEIQIQNLSLEKIESVMRDLLKTGLSTKGGGGNTVRNILVSEYSGISAEECFDTTPYAMELTTKLIAEPDSYLLPRKMKIAFSSDDNYLGYAAINDVGFVAKIKDGEKGFQVYVGGGGGSKPSVGWLLFDFIPVGELYVVAEALKKFFSEHGNRKNKNKARLRFVFYKLGEDETIRLIKEYYREAKRETPVFILPIEENERPEYSYKPVKDESSDTEEYRLWRKRYVKPQRQEGYNSIFVPVLLGNIPLNDTTRIEGLQNLLTFVNQFGEQTIRFITAQSIRLRNIPDIALPELFRILNVFIPDLHAPLILNNIISCTGADTCRLGIGLSKDLATAIRRELLRSYSDRNDPVDLDKLSAVRIHISGCPNSCGQQHWADIGFSGKILRNERLYPGYQVYLAAHRSAAPKLADPIGNISARDIPKFVRRLLETYLNSDAGSLTSYLESEGRNIALALIEEYKDIPSFAEDKNYYYDWGAETLFSVVGRGAAECSAGLFDMIEVDLGIINANKDALEGETDIVKRNNLLYGIIYSSARMLLVTRGAEPKTTEDVFNLFIRNFIEYGFVEERFRDIVTIARDETDYSFNSHKDEIYDLAGKIIDLYQNMDDSLQFKNIPPKQPVDADKKNAIEEKRISEAHDPDAAQIGILQETKERKFKDLRGVACPMNFVQTKILLATMQPGEKLEIWLDDGQPINNVPGSVRNEGHEILEQTSKDDYWIVVIKKK
ncbi:MAG: sulfurtransferase TusA family protein [Tannerella sp.]|jgi:sulfite reductase (ferredoxin)|nr:sulfurtransferase TusA family protein [Tannerella sp.]